MSGLTNPGQQFDPTTTADQQELAYRLQRFADEIKRSNQQTNDAIAALRAELVAKGVL